MSIKDATNNNTITTKARYWAAVAYPENMRSDWQQVIGEVLQLPYAYCIHDKDVDGDADDRKVHVHILVAWNNNTTYKSALETFRLLNAPGKEAFNTCCKVQNIRYYYNYLIHDTEDSRKKHKHAYAPEERIVGNNFDIGCYEQISLADKRQMRRELSQIIIEKGFINYMDFYTCVVTNFTDDYEEVCVNFSGHFERLTKGNYQKWLRDQGKTE